MNTNHTLLERYLLYTMLKRTTQEAEHVQEIASMLDCCIPSFEEASLSDGKTIAEDAQDDDKDITERLSKDIPAPNIREAVLADFYHLDTEHRRVVEKFMTDPFFCDGILSFIGFAASALLHIQDAPRCSVAVLLHAFNGHALEFFCKRLEPQDVKLFLEICGESLGLMENARLATKITGWTYYFAIWAVKHGRCSFWRLI